MNEKTYNKNKKKKKFFILLLLHGSSALFVTRCCVVCTRLVGLANGLVGLWSLVRATVVL